MAKTEKYTAEEMVAAVYRGRGLVTAIAKFLGCDPKTVRRYRTKYATVQAAFNEAREQQLDITEGKLFDAIRKGQAWAIKYYLTTQGHSRGYNVQVVIARALLALKGENDEQGMNEFMDSIDALLKKQASE